MLNKIILIGRLGEDPNHTVLKDGQELVEFSFATEERYKDLKNTEWHRVKMFGPLAQVMKKYGFKGQLIYLEGKIHYSSWEKDGVKHYSTEIICNTLKILEWKEEEPKVNPWP
jgi:single-strand DNA-binding protein